MHEEGEKRGERDRILTEQKFATIKQSCVLIIQRRFKQFYGVHFKISNIPLIKNVFYARYPGTWNVNMAQQLKRVVMFQCVSKK